MPSAGKAIPRSAIGTPPVHIEKSPYNIPLGCENIIKGSTEE
ncbi:MAG: hypothetical protein ACUVT5_06795 [Candidatus Bathyarchaeales archaeon]